MGGGDGNGADDDYVHEQREGSPNFKFFSVQGIPLSHLRAHVNALGTSISGKKKKKNMSEFMTVHLIMTLMTQSFSNILIKILYLDIYTVSVLI